VQSFTNVCAEMGMQAGAHVLEQRIVTARDEERRLFGEDCDKLVYISRVRTADGLPIMEERNLLPLNGFSFLLEADLEDASFFEVLNAGSGRNPQTSGSSTIEIALADAQMAKNLQIATGDPLFYEHVFFVDQNGAPLCLSNKYLVGSRYQFDI
jgi:GntR family transcriptional regulator